MRERESCEGKRKREKERREGYRVGRLRKREWGGRERKRATGSGEGERDSNYTCTYILMFRGTIILLSSLVS